MRHWIDHEHDWLKRIGYFADSRNFCEYFGYFPCTCTTTALISFFVHSH